ncbi:MAG: TIGR04282 family arsenosugar biosynthesis glycosyltransferase [Lunatimonas sp.]|uniref:TIGR04282 family arsenosugar biosynthesis glycosyltransferase n=1 Tax=Lunatimonas sp. TaxID=2060141 RepID=UPI00263B1116|nr:TIGR04282 family arsenosugar biosynthesis glycosyltransferase [Lunatimonas sp.]MCC5937287.1 TIGR04282 family arsenosugar biosynthesis glycosyltransferase [Lunatimonas sp.]
MKQAVIVFQRTPEHGKVKTRLAVDIGEEDALRVYKFLLRHTHRVLESLSADIHVFVTGACSDDSSSPPPNYYFHRQQGIDLGARMNAAFVKVLTLGYERVMIIGTDCYELSSEILRQAFVELAHKDLVIGPAQDGGYYLLGLTKPTPHLFTEIPWSTSSVCSDTLRRAKELGLTCGLLPVLRDVDTAEDLGVLRQLLDLGKKITNFEK